MKILFIGDIMGRAGRDMARRGIPKLVERHDIDVVIANVENAAAGFGITRDIGDELRGYGIDVMTSLRSRDVPGGTAPRQVAAALRKARKTVDTILRDVAPGLA